MGSTTKTQAGTTASIVENEINSSSRSSINSASSSSKGLLQETVSTQHGTFEATSVQISESEVRPSKMVITLTLASSISGFMFGYDTGYISSALVQIGTDLSNKILTSGEKELITSATSLGALIGAIIGGILANILGRRIVLLGSNVILLLVQSSNWLLKLYGL